MPKHNTPHWTDGDGIGQKLVGPELTLELNRLARTANAHHRQAGEAMQGWIEHARQAGEALLQAKRRCGHKTKWSQWRRANFKGSKETSCDYMRVAREWNNPVIVEAREAGVAIDSINKIKKLLRGEPLTAKPKDKAPSNEERDHLRNALRREFVSKLQGLSDLELETLAKSDWKGMYTFDRLWDKMHERLKTAVAVLYGEDDDDDDEDDKYEPAPRPERRKVSKALTERGKTKQLAKSHPK